MVVFVYIASYIIYRLFPTEKTQVASNKHIINQKLIKIHQDHKYQGDFRGKGCRRSGFRFSSLEYVGVLNCVLWFAYSWFENEFLCKFNSQIASVQVNLGIPLEEPESIHRYNSISLCYLDQICSCIFGTVLILHGILQQWPIV